MKCLGQGKNSIEYQNYPSPFDNEENPNYPSHFENEENEIGVSVTYPKTEAH